MSGTKTVVRLLFSTFVCAASLLPIKSYAVDTVFFVVRHAEKADETPDPPLSAKGMRRAKQLMQTLKSLKVDAAYHTQLVRAKATALPLAKKMHFTPEAYEDASPDWINSVVAAQKGKRVLIVGHSNTVSEIVSRLSGKDIPPIGDHYDNLFIVVVSDESKSVVRLKYGEAN